ncbi:MAG: hypothetical protein WAM54_14045 [Nitrososphaeraceae archaeon]
MSRYSISSKTSKIVIVAAIIYIITFFALASGLINALIEGAAASSQALILPTRSAQTLIETVVLVFVLFIGLGGAIMIYRAGQGGTAKTQGAFLASGFALVAISLMLGFNLVNLKG